MPCPSIELPECVKGELKSPLSTWRPKNLSRESSGKPWKKRKKLPERTNRRTDTCNNEPSFESHLSPAADKEGYDCEYRRSAVLHEHEPMHQIGWRSTRLHDGGYDLSGSSVRCSVWDPDLTNQGQSGSIQNTKVRVSVSVWKVRTKFALCLQYQQNNVGLLQTFYCTGLSLFWCIFVWWSRSNTSVMFSRLFNKS